SRAASARSRSTLEPCIGCTPRSTAGCFTNTATRTIPVGRRSRWTSRATASRIHILHLPSRTLVTHDVTATLWSTPLVADVRGTGRLELIALAWLVGSGGTPSHPDATWQLLRLDLSAKTPPVRSWAGYMGTSTDGQYHAAMQTPRE